MKILIIGSGAREYSIGLKCAESLHELYFYPGNGATPKLGENVSLSGDGDNKYHLLADWADKNGIDLAIVGPEDALTEGVVDIFKETGLLIFGPSKKAARLEGSKAYMKEFLAKYGIKTARFINTDNLQVATEFINSLSGDGGDKKIVVKADGLCAGKGVIIANKASEAVQAASQMLCGASFGEAGRRVVIEEFLDGFELSFFAICDGERFVSLPVAQDHKKLGDGDTGPNTGGMGAYAPSPLADKKLIERVENEVIKPTLKGMQNEGAPFCGVLFVGLMVVGGEPYVLEFNVRFGDPECEVLMPLIDGDLGEILKDAAAGRLNQIKLKDDFAVGVVMASENYPFKSSEPALIKLAQIPSNAHISFAGVSKKDGELYASGGRVLVAVGVAKSISQAAKSAYEAVSLVEFKGAKYRRDIAYQAL